MTAITGRGSPHAFPVVEKCSMRCPDKHKGGLRFRLGMQKFMRPCLFSSDSGTYKF